MTEMMRTNNKAMTKLYQNRTPIMEECRKVQLTTAVKHDEYETEVIDRPCNRIEGNLCSTCASPELKWKAGKCNFASHLYMEPKKDEKKILITPINEEVTILEAEKMLNPIKYSKRGR